jgi:hypothetical protein
VVFEEGPQKRRVTARGIHGIDPVDEVADAAAGCSEGLRYPVAAVWCDCGVVQGCGGAYAGKFNTPVM